MEGEIAASAQPIPQLGPDDVLAVEFECAARFRDNPHHVRAPPLCPECARDLVCRYAQLERTPAAKAMRAAGGERVTLDQCLAMWGKEEVLGNNDQWYCRTCEEHVSAKKQLSLFALPEVFVVHLKRFRYDNRLHRRGRINTIVRWLRVSTVHASNHLWVLRRSNFRSEGSICPRTLPLVAVRQLAVGWTVSRRPSRRCVLPRVACMTSTRSFNTTALQVADTTLLSHSIQRRTRGTFTMTPVSLR